MVNITELLDRESSSDSTLNEDHIKTIFFPYEKSVSFNFRIFVSPEGNMFKFKRYLSLDDKSRVGDPSVYGDRSDPDQWVDCKGDEIDMEKASKFTELSDQLDYPVGLQKTNVVFGSIYPGGTLQESKYISKSGDLCILACNYTTKNSIISFLKSLATDNNEELERSLDINKKGILFTATTDEKGALASISVAMDKGLKPLKEDAPEYLEEQFNTSMVNAACSDTYTDEKMDEALVLLQGRVDYLLENSDNVEVTTDIAQTKKKKKDKKKNKK